MDDYKENLFQGATGNLFEFSKALRQTCTEAEDILWQALRRKQLNGLKFRRQHPLKNYIADFYCHEYKLVIEVDGEIHDLEEHKQADVDRTLELGKLGITVIRFTNKEITKDLPVVLDKIIKFK